MSEYATPVGATREDIARVLTSADPVSEVRKQVGLLEHLEDWVLAEKTKWDHALSLAEMLSETPAHQVDDAGPGLVEPGDEASATSATNGRGPEIDAEEPPGRPTRRQGILTIMNSEPTRSWKLAEIIAELKARGWATGSQHEDAMVLKTLGAMKKKNVVRRPRTGYYRLVASTPTSGSQPPQEDANDD